MLLNVSVVDICPQMVSPNSFALLNMFCMEDLKTAFFPDRGHRLNVP